MWVFSDARVVASMVKHLVNMLIQQTSWEGTLPQTHCQYMIIFYFPIKGPILLFGSQGKFYSDIASIQFVTCC